jgi:hypothetical protein
MMFKKALVCCILLMPMLGFTNTGLVRASAIAYSISPKSDITWNTTCSHLTDHNMLAITVYTTHNKTALNCLRAVRNRYRHYVVYSLGYNNILLIASNTHILSWPKNTALLHDFLGNQRTLAHFNPVTDTFWAHKIRWYWSDIARFLPLDQLYPSLLKRHVSRLGAVFHRPNVDISRLRMQVFIASPEAMLTASTRILLKKSGIPRIGRQFALGVAMLSNVRLEQYRAVLLLWDRYGKVLFLHHDIPVDFYFLYQYAHAKLPGQ